MARVNIGDTDLNADWVKYLPEHDGETELYEREGVKGGPGSGHRGHRGRPGFRGGSQPGGSIAGLRGRVPIDKLEVNDLPPEEKELTGWAGMNRLGRAMDDAAGTWDYRNASMSTREIVKRDVVENITERIAGERPKHPGEFPVGDPPSPEELWEYREKYWAWMKQHDEVNDFVKQWAYSSNDEDMRSLAIQRDAAEEFGLPLSEFTREKIDAVEADYRRYTDNWLRSMYPEFDSMPDKEKNRHRRELREHQEEHDENLNYRPLLPSSQQRRILRAMYNETQSKLREMGFKPGSRIVVMRGVKLPVEVAGEWKKGDRVRFDGNTVESWSIGLDVAIQFAGGGGTGRRSWRGVVLSTSVPVEMLLSTSLTGFGCLKEGEVTILGSDGDAEVVVVN